MSDLASMTPEQLAEALEQAAKASVDLHHNMNLGTFFMAAATDTLLCGVMIVQLTSYWTWSKGDRWFNKSIVLITSISSIVATIYIIVLMFRLFVYHFGEYTPFASLPLLTYMSIIDIVPAVATQIFFTERAYKMCNRSKILLLTISTFLLMSVIGAVGFPPARGKIGLAGASRAVLSKTFVYLWLSGSLAADLLITSSIMYSLIKSRTGWKQTDETISKLLKIMIETQLHPTVLIIFLFVVSLGFKDTYLDVYPLWVQSKFYTCGLLASLNSRYSLRRALANESSSHGATNKRPVVHVLTETYVQSGDPGSSSSPATTSHRPNFSHQPHRIIPKDPLEMDDDSIELEDKTPHDSKSNLNINLGNSSDNNQYLSENENENGGHKLDYIDNESKTGLTDHGGYNGR